MKSWLLRLLCCPSCSGLLTLDNEIREKEEIRSGNLTCRTCRASFQIIDSIPRFTRSDQYVKNFSLQWNIHSHTQYGALSDRTLCLKTGLSIDDLRDRLVLDAGCGSGRFSDVVSRAGGMVVGVDLSYSIDAAFKEIGLRENVCLVQCDLLRMPFKSRSFDIAFSIGVVHHTRFPKGAATEIARLVKNNGIMSIWVYASWKDLNKKSGAMRTYHRISYAISDFYRVFTSRMAAPTLYGLINKLSFVSRLTHHTKLSYFINLLFRCSNSSDVNQWKLDTFDWYSPRYHFKFTYEELVEWFLELGFTKITRLDFPVAVKGILKKG